MDRIADQLSEIEAAAKAIVENAEEQKHVLEGQMQEKRDEFDARMEAETKEKIKKIQLDFQKNMEQKLRQQEEKNQQEIQFLKQDFEKHHTIYAEELLKKILET